MALRMAQDALAMIEYGNEPAVLLLSDSSAGFARGRRAAELLGARVGGEAFIEAAAERLDRQVSASAVIVDIERDHGEALDRLLDRLDRDAKEGRHGSVVETPPALIDVVAARTHLLQLCRPSEVERVSALAVAAAREPARVQDVGRHGATARLQQLSEEVGRIAGILAALSEEEIATSSPQSDDQAEPPDASQIRAVIRARRLRDHFFPSDIFADPAWDMLLDLMAARSERRKVAVSSLCIAAAVPATTALRWIKALTEAGIFVRSADPQDGRRVFIELSESASNSMAGYFRALQRMGSFAV